MAQIHVVGMNAGRFENLGGGNDSGGLITQPASASDPCLKLVKSGEINCLECSLTGQGGYGVSIVGTGTESGGITIDLTGATSANTGLNVEVGASSSPGVLVFHSGSSHGLYVERSGGAGTGLTLALGGTSTGIGLDVNMTNASNTVAGVDVSHVGSGDGITISKSPATSKAGYGLGVTMGANCTSAGMYVGNSGVGNSLYIEHGASTEAGILLNTGGDSTGLYISTGHASAYGIQVLDNEGSSNPGIYVAWGGTGSGVYARNTGSGLAGTFAKYAIVETQTPGLLCVNMTAATDPVPEQYSPMIVQRGQAWSNALGATKLIEFATQVETIESGTSLATGNLHWYYRYDGDSGSWVDAGYLTAAGRLVLNGGLALTTFATGSIPFAKAAAIGQPQGTLGEDNANLNWNVGSTRLTAANLTVTGNTQLGDAGADTLDVHPYWAKFHNYTAEVLLGGLITVDEAGITTDDAVSANGVMATVRGKDASATDAGGALLLGGNATASNFKGGWVLAIGGNGFGNQSGGNCLCIAGPGGATGVGGDAFLWSGAGGATSGRSGELSLATGATTNGQSGDASLKTGNAATGATGPITIATGNASTTSGNITLNVGTGATKGEIRLANSVGCNINLGGNNSTVIALGGGTSDTISFYGYVDTSVTFKTGAERNLTIQTQTAGASVAFTIYGQTATAASNNNGGAVVFRGGTADGTGAGGAGILRGGLDSGGIGGDPNQYNPGMVQCTGANTTAGFPANGTRFGGTLYAQGDWTTGVGGTVIGYGGKGATGTNSNGGFVAFIGGLADGSGTGGAATLSGGPGGLGSGNGGATSVTGGVSGATGGTSGTLTLAGGMANVGSGSSGGHAYLRGGAKDGAGTDGTVYIGDSNTAVIAVGSTAAMLNVYPYWATFAPTTTSYTTKLILGQTLAIAGITTGQSDDGAGHQGFTTVKGCDRATSGKAGGALVLGGDHNGNNGEGGITAVISGKGGASDGTAGAGAGGAVVVYTGLGGAASGTFPGGKGGDLLLWGNTGGAGAAAATAGHGGDIQLAAGAAGAANGGTGERGGDISLGAGAGTGTGRGGRIAIDAGVGGGGAGESITIGGSNAGSVGIGRAAITTTINGTLNVGGSACSANVTGTNLSTLTAGASSDASALHTHVGMPLSSTYTAGTGGVTQYDVVYLANDGGNLRAFPAYATSETTTRPIGLATATAAAGNSFATALGGEYTAHFDSTPAAADAGKPVYLSVTTAGQVTLTAPTTTGHVSIRIGYLAQISGTAYCKIALHIGDPFVQ